MKLNELHDNPGSRYVSKRVGRGLGSGKGKTCGSGQKGQKSRTGVAINGFEGGQMPIHRRLPKRGFKSLSRTTYLPINLGVLNSFIEKDKLPKSGVITKEMIKEAGLIKSSSSLIKLLSKGEINFPVSVEVDASSATATEKLTKKGGKVVLLSGKADSAQA